MKLSIYTYLFEKSGQYYLYNSQTGFLSTIEKKLYEQLFDHNFEALGDEIINVLKTKEIIVEDGHLYDYYYKKRQNYFTSIGNQESLGLVIAPTTGCNFECPYCFEGEKTNKCMSPEVVDDLIEFINSYKQTRNLKITWYGGEPLMAFSIIKTIVEKIRERCAIENLTQSIVTNGYLINDDVIDFMKSNQFESIQISFDGTDVRHNNTRYLKGSHQPSYDRILFNVDRLYNEMHKEFKINLRINVNKENEDDFFVMRQLLKERFPDKRVTVYPGFIREEGKGNRSMCYNSLFGKSRYDFYKKVAKQGMAIDFYPHEKEKGCMVCINNSFVIGPNGEMYKCWSDFNNPDRVVGSIRERKITNATLISRYTFESTIYSDKRCKDCKLFPICDGGCSWFRYKNVFEGKKYDLCTFLSDDTRLEECLLMEQPKSEEISLKAV